MTTQNQRERSAPATLQRLQPLQAREPKPGRAPDPTRKDDEHDNDSGAPPSYLFDLIGYDELDKESIGLSPPEGYHLESWKSASNAIVVCWEHDDL